MMIVRFQRVKFFNSSLWLNFDHNIILRLPENVAFWEILRETERQTFRIKCP